MITISALNKCCFWRCFFWQDFPKVHSRGLCVCWRGWSMNGDLFTLSGSLLVLTKFSCFLVLSFQIQISLRDFFAHKNPLTFRNINIVKKKKKRCLTSLFCFIKPAKLSIFISLEIFCLLFWMQIKATWNFHRYTNNKIIGWLFLLDSWVKCLVCKCVCACKSAYDFIQKWDIVTSISKEIRKSWP